ncbi:MAG: hypothetical protein NC433_01770 [Clostridiales bacterium]|nr:hypothetical protein [Clostridiales bacterium]
MLFFAIQFDEKRVLRDNKINLQAAYESLDMTFAQKDVTLYKIKDGVHYYTRNIDKHDFEYLWMVNLAFDDCDWFKKYIKVWRFINIEDGVIIDEEDLLEDDERGKDF